MFSLPSPLEKIEHDVLDEHDVNLFFKRDDLIHPDISGNKWRKLKYNFKDAQRKGYRSILTFGGAFSNHIAATAAAANYFDLEAVGIIRGQELNASSNQTLRRSREHGMTLKFISRSEYKASREDPDVIKKAFSEYFIIPEGGCNFEGIRGVSEILEEIDVPFQTIICPIGTGTTITGLAKGLKDSQRVLGFSCLKGDFMRKEVREMHSQFDIPWDKTEVNVEYHFGGYGRTTTTLIEFINQMHKEIGVILDPIYTGKALFGVWKMIQQGIFDNQTLIFLHTGGLQGIAGFNQKSLRKIHI